MIQFKRVQFKAQFVFHGEVVREIFGATYDTAAASVTFLVKGKPCIKPWADVEFAEPSDVKIVPQEPSATVKVREPVRRKV